MSFSETDRLTFSDLSCKQCKINGTLSLKMTHRLEDAAAAATIGNNDAYDDLETGGGLNGMMPNSRGTVQYVPLRNLKNPLYSPAEVDDHAYENLIRIPAADNSLAAIKVLNILVLKIDLVRGGTKAAF